MNLVKIAILISFSACAFVCVGYAHSATRQAADPNVSEWRNSNLLIGGCRLTIQKTGGSTVLFKTGESRTRFEGFWPDQPGDVFTQVPTRRDLEGRATLEPGLLPEPDETLLVRFENVNGKIVPTSFKYADNRERKTNNGSVKLEPKVCPSLSRVE